MKCNMLATALILLASGLAGADYLAIKVDLKNVTLNVAYPMENAPGQEGGFPQPGGQQGEFGQPKGVIMQPPGQPGAAVDLVDHLWITVYLELKGLPKSKGPAVEIDHQYGKKTYIPLIPRDPNEPNKLPFLQVAQLQKEPLQKEHAKLLKKIKDKDTKALVNLAFWDWSHGLMKEFHATIEEIKKIDPKHAVVARHAKIQNQLKAPLVEEDPASKDYLAELRGEGYRMLVSDKGHYALYFNLTPVPENDARIKRRLLRLEESLESFYYWFALQETIEKIPPMPRYRLLGQVINDPNDFQRQYKSWGTPPLVGDGFTPRRDSIMILSAKRLDEAFAYLEMHALKWRQTINAPAELLVSGDIWKRPETKNAPLPFAIIQTMAVIQKAMEEESERTTLSHEAVRQLLAATGILPRNIVAPEWVHSGLASYFETPLGAVYGTGGLPSWSNLVPFKSHYKAQGKGRDILYNTLTDQYFGVARVASADLLDGRENADKVNDDWERARATSWALVYYLIKDQKFDKLLRYTSELSQLPRDLELDQRALEGCFARAFALSDAKNALKLDPARLQGFAEAWFGDMETVALELPGIEEETMRTRKANASTPAKKKAATPKGVAPPVPPPSGN